MGRFKKATQIKRVRFLLDPPSCSSALDTWRAADPARNSPDVDYGMSWSSKQEPECRWRVSWNTGSGDLYAVDVGEQTVIELGHCTSREDADTAIEDWANVHKQADGLDRLFEHLKRHRPSADGPSIA